MQLSKLELAEMITYPIFYYPKQVVTEVSDTHLVHNFECLCTYSKYFF